MKRSEDNLWGINSLLLLCNSRGGIQAVGLDVKCPCLKAILTSLVRQISESTLSFRW